MTTLKKFACAGLAVSSLFSTAAVTQGDPISNPRGTVANFDVSTLLPILSELGVPATAERAASNGVPFVGAKYGNLNFTIHPTACLGANTTNCVGALVLATFSGYSPNYQSVAAFDERHAFADAGIFTGQSVVYIGRYDIADFGFARGNVAISLGTFIGLADKLWQELESGAKTVSAEGYADDMMAGALNRRQVSGAGQEDDPHMLALELVQQFARDNVAVGADNRKIRNID